ncbi:MAG: thiamine pyrophosphate-dependent dehydrogenase E1 component subunit alpha [Verrucomicrobiales bacterium]
MRRAFRAMLTARLLENKLSSLYKAGKIVGGVYLGTGQEALSASLGSLLEKGRDIFAPLIRDQAGRCAFGEDLLDATRTYLGSAQGPMRGRDGNIHRGRPAEGMPAMISHLGAAVSQVAGMLIARRFQGKMDGIVGATCLGDGATSTGAFHEGLNLAAVEKLPLVLVIADNQFAYSTPNSRQFACESLVEKAAGYGVGGTEVDGTDLSSCLRGLQQAITSARQGYGPQLVVARLLRLCGHGEHDDGSYVPPGLKDSLIGRDCLQVAEEQVLAKNLLSSDEVAGLKEEITAQVQQAVATAQREATPDPFRTEWRATSSPGL